MDYSLQQILPEEMSRGRTIKLKMDANAGFLKIFKLKDEQKSNDFCHIQVIEDDIFGTDESWEVASEGTVLRKNGRYLASITGTSACANLDSSCGPSIVPFGRVQLGEACTRNFECPLNVEEYDENAALQEYRPIADILCSADDLWYVCDAPCARVYDGGRFGFFVCNEDGGWDIES